MKKYILKVNEISDSIKDTELGRCKGKDKLLLKLTE